MNATRIKFLTVATSIVIFIGFLGISSVFINALNPSAKAGDKLPLADISTIDENSYLFFIERPSQKSNTSSSTVITTGIGYLILKESKNTLNVFRIPMYNGKVAMPYHFWGLFDGECSDFGVDYSDKNKIIKCKDDNPFFKHQWSLSGKSLIEPFPDLIKTEYRYEQENTIRIMDRG